ncbi:MAG: cutinase family protein [Gordonia sp. (in: high G+C Gram-positive bacteria)]|uniref:cutinase family protein n=1 Tax=Gordonia sp. (in: high G+C Gram-positive bacteria) TaxID=84139 RepID=UPI0039E3F0D8
MNAPGRIDLYRVINLDPAAPPHVLAGQLQHLLTQVAPGPDQAYLQRALAILGDPAKKQAYDALLADPAAPVTDQTLNAMAGPQANVAPAAHPAHQPTHPGPVAASAPQTGAMLGQPTWPAPAAPRKKPRFSKKVLAAGIGGAVVLLIAMIGIVGGLSSSSANCADVIFIGAAGSGQRSAEAMAADDGMGNIVNDTYQNLLSDANDAGKKVEKRAVDYPALDISMVWSPEYAKSIETGQLMATGMILNAMKECRKSKIVAVGYSQGAMVMHRALWEIKTNGNVIGLLIADGDRVINDPNVLYDGGAANYPGIAYSKLGQGQSAVYRTRQFSNKWRGNIGSWCEKGDTICSNQPGVNEGLVKGGIGAYVHTHSYDASDWRQWIKQKALGTK